VFDQAIMHDEKTVGTTPYILVNDLVRRCGIFIENMLEAAG